jgi:hypothetical protein
MCNDCSNTPPLLPGSGLTNPLEGKTMRLCPTLFVLLLACSPGFSSAQLLNLSNDRIQITELHGLVRFPLTVITDGVVEARNLAGELFGFDRTAALAAQPAEQIANAAQQFGQEDDITVLTLTFAPAEVLRAYARVARAVSHRSHLASE